MQAMRIVAAPAADDRAGFIEIAGVGKRYPVRGGAPVTALADIDLKIAEGEFVCVVGPSGCGKSTLLRILAGIVPSHEGTVSLDGRRITGPSRDVGVVFQQPHLLPWRTVMENVMLPVELQHRSGKEYRERAEHLIALVGLGEFASRYPGELSGGMQQRVGICRALVHDPKVLLMDEPFGALDAMTREFMSVELLRIWSSNRKTALFITHSIVEAVFLADRVVVMSPRPGRIEEIVGIDLPRPRTPEMMTSAAFGDYGGRIRSHFELKAGVDL
ncbi:MAG: ABC transporter ATP-binding protein [Rhizobiales bacterium]|nr:ABC transporter ATP-binding protein [Hyphomicrobiales bacterium]